MIKRLTCTLATLALLMVISIPARAEFRGTLQRNLPWFLEITSGSADTISATVYYLGRDLEVIEIMSVQVGESVLRNIPKPGRGVKRVVVDVDPPFSGRATIRIVQGETTFLDDITSSQAGDTLRFVFDVE